MNGADDLVVGDLIVPGAELEERFDTSGGPGGQHANRTETAVTLRFDIANSSLPDEVRERLVVRLGPVVEVRATESRSQSRNRLKARARLAHRLEDARQEPKPRKKTGPSAQARERRLAEKKARADLKKSRKRPSDFD